MQMDRNEMNRRRDVALRHLFDELVASNCQALRVESQHIQMPGVLYFRALDWDFQCVTFGERLHIRIDDFSPALLKTIQLPQLA